MKKWAYVAKVMNRFDRHIEELSGVVEAGDEDQARKAIRQLHTLLTEIKSLEEVK